MTILTYPYKGANTLYIDLNHLENWFECAELALDYIATNGRGLVVSQNKDGKELLFRASYQTQMLIPNINPFIECHFYVDNELVYCIHSMCLDYKSDALNSTVYDLLDGRNTKNGKAYDESLLKEFIAFDSTLFDVETMGDTDDEGEADSVVNT